MPSGNGGTTWPHENGNGRDPLAGLPWWVRAIVVVGVPSAIALGLVWSDRIQLADQVIATGLRVREVQSEAKAHDERTLLRFEQLGRATSETNRILTASCVNDAKTIEARERCVGSR